MDNNMKKQTNTNKNDADKGKSEERRDAGSEADAVSSDVSAGGGSESPRREKTGTAAENSKFFRKRSWPEGDHESSSEGELASARKIPTSKRGGIRGKGRGLSAAQSAARLAEEGRHPGVAGHGVAPSGTSGDEAGAAGGSDAERKSRFAAEVEAALKVVAHKMKPSAKFGAIPAASASILAAAEAAYARPLPGEVAKLRAEVARLTAATAAAAPRSGPSSQPSGRAVLAPEKPAPVKPAPVKGAVAQKKGKAVAQKKGKAAAPVAGQPPPPQQQQRPLPPPPPPKPAAAEAGWQVVGEKQRGRKAAKKARRAERKRQQKARSVAARLRAPKTAAVVITLQPDAEKRGVSYRDVLAKAKATVDLGELGITEGLRLNVTAIGARVLEIPGENSGSSADALAEKLIASLNADEARVSRPVRCADLRILGLDDSVTEEEVVAAVTRTGGCPAELVKTGTLRPDHRGMRTITVSCPVTAARTIVEGRRLLVGWVSAQVKLLEPRPLRCFRCHVGHHVSVQCTSEVDRSGLCFRCSQPGHMAAACSATPHCAACAAAGKPADHRARSKACAQPTKARGRGRRRPSATTPTVATAAAAATVATAAAATAAAAATSAAGPS